MGGKAADVRRTGAAAGAFGLGGALEGAERGVGGAGGATTFGGWGVCN
jgi:hypothetical protein